MLLRSDLFNCALVSKSIFMVISMLIVNTTYFRYFSLSFNSFFQSNQLIFSYSIYRYGFCNWYKPKKLIINVKSIESLIPLITFPITHLEIRACGKNSKPPPFASLHTHPLSSLPASITHLAFINEIDPYELHDKNIEAPLLPPSLTHLTFSRIFNMKVDSLAPLLTHLTFGYAFNQKVNNLPHSLVNLEFGRTFDQRVDSLPHSLTHLTFGSNFNQLVDLLPHSITHLTFGFWFNKQVDLLPHTLISIVFGFKFNQPINSLPPTLKQIEFKRSSFYGSNSEFQQPIDKLPPSIIHLIIPKRYSNSPFAPSVKVTYV